MAAALVQAALDAVQRVTAAGATHHADAVSQAHIISQLHDWLQ